MVIFITVNFPFFLSVERVAYKRALYIPSYYRKNIHHNSLKSLQNSTWYQSRIKIPDFRKQSIGIISNTIS
jgi:hypothetical protein